MKLSIIMPTYNSEEYLEQAIISVQRQITKNIELIIINDGSEDHTEKICKMYKSKYIHYVEIEHSGAGCARNIGINMAEGEWISFLDSDDLYLSRRLNDEFIEILDESLRAGIDIISTPRLKTDMYLQYEPKETPAQKIYMIRNHMPKLEFWTCIYKKSFLLANKIKFYEYVKQDIESAFRYLAFSRTNKIRVCNNMPFYLQRNNPKSNTHTWDRYCLNEIKSEVYIDLLKQTLLEQDNPFLAQVALEQIDSYYTMCLADGYNSVEGLNRVQENVLKLKKILRFIPLNREQTKLAEEVFKKDYEIRNKECKNKLQKIERIQNRIQYLEIDKQIILKRLDLISNQVNGRKEWGM